MKSSFAGWIACVLFGISSLAGEAFATSFVDRPFDQTVQQAPLMVRGIIGNKFGRKAAANDGHSSIFTYYEFQVGEVFKGSGPAVGEQISIRELGGEAGGVGLQVAGSAVFDKGEDVVVILGDRNPDQSYTLRGLMTGKYGIEKGPQGDEYLIGAGVKSLTMTDDPDHPHDVENEHLLQGEGERKSKSWSLSDLRTLVREQAGDPPSATSTSTQQSGTPTKLSTLTPSLDRQESEASKSAPPLQSEVSGDSSPGTNLTLWALGALAVLLILVGSLFRNNRK